MLKIEINPIADTGYIYLSSKHIVYTKEVTEDLLVDIAEDGTAVGIDIRHWSEWVYDEQNFPAKAFGV